MSVKRVDIDWVVRRKYSVILLDEVEKIVCV